MTRQRYLSHAVAAVVVGGFLHASVLAGYAQASAGAGGGSGLDEAQRQLLRIALQKANDPLQKLEEQLRAAQQKLMQVVVAESYDEKVVREKAELVAQIQTEIVMLRSKALSLVAPTLKPAQRSQLVDSRVGMMMLSGGFGGVQVAPMAPIMGGGGGTELWTAAVTGNLVAIARQLAAGRDINAKGPVIGGSPLIGAALFGQTEAARLLVRNGAKLEARDNNGSSALQVAAFLGYPEIVKLLAEAGAEVNAKNNNGQTPLDVAEVEWSPALEGVYRYIGGVLSIQLDLDCIKAMRPEVADILRKHGGKRGKE